MLKHLARWSIPSSHLPILPNLNPPNFNCATIIGITNTDKALNFNHLSQTVSWRRSKCSARRRVRYEEEDDDEDEDEDEYGHNEELARLELYSQTARGEAILVHALLDDQEVEVLVFKGFSSSLSHGTSPDPSWSVLPSRVVIKSKALLILPTLSILRKVFHGPHFRPVSLQQLSEPLIYLLSSVLVAIAIES